MKKMRIIVCGVLALSVCFSHAVPATFIFPSQITSAPFSITSPGLYVLTDDVTFTRAGGTAITISSNDVILDLHGKTIINSGAGVESGISLASTLTNVTVRNGGLRVFDGTGVRANAGCIDLNFENLNIVGFGITIGTGFNFLGTSGSALRTSGVWINNCSVSNCLQGLVATAADAAFVQNSTFNSNGTQGISATDDRNWTIDKCQASFNSSAASTCAGLRILDGRNWVIKNSDFSGNIGTASRGLISFASAIVRSHGGHFIENCTFCDNTSSGVTNGLELDLTNSCVVINCVCTGNSSSDGQTTGIQVTGSAVIIENCVTEGNYNQSGATFVAGISLSGTAHHVVHCRANNNTKLSGNETASGIRVTGIGHFIEQCEANANSSLGSGGSVAGVGVLVLSGASTCLVKNCVAAGDSHQGFNCAAAAGANLFIGNAAFGHGASNYAGVGAPAFLSVAATGAYPLAGSFDNRGFANLSFT